MDDDGKPYHSIILPCTVSERIKLQLNRSQ